MRLRGAHPRSRGENVCECLPVGCVCGSSPLTRGKRTRARIQDDVYGLIPAHAGKTTATPIQTPDKVGSSPLTRGKPFGHVGFRGRRRLIPAHAGKTHRDDDGDCSGWAHPRSRGENLDGERETAEEWGSSPLTRGKLSVSVLRDLVTGLIPAHAGKTRMVIFISLQPRAHPRSRGENW